MLLENLDIFLNEFSVTASINIGGNAKSIKVIFDEFYADMYGGDADGKTIEVMAKTTDVVGVRTNDFLIIGTDYYKIIGVEGDDVDTAFTNLKLKSSASNILNPNSPVIPYTPPVLDLDVVRKIASQTIGGHRVVILLNGTVKLADNRNLT